MYVTEKLGKENFCIHLSDFCIHLTLCLDLRPTVGRKLAVNYVVITDYRDLN